MSRSEKLLVRVFASVEDGRYTIKGSQVDTDEGTRPLWSYLEAGGLVQRATKTGPGVLGHYFSYRLTDTGRAHIQALKP